MVQESHSPPGAFAAAIKRADVRTRAAQSQQAQPTKIEHGHEGDATPAAPPSPPTVAEQLKMGRPRNADGSPRED